MRKRFFHTMWALGVVLAFFGGVTAGVYYYAEITVWLANVGIFEEAAGPTTQAPQQIDADTSVLTMKTLEEPLPLVYSETLDEPTIQEYLKQGAVVLPLGKTFGQPGNVVVTAHSSGSTAFGPYRFAFAKLAEVQPGDEFTIRTPEGSFTYRAYAQEIVWPHEVDKLPNDERSTVTLVTCWPLWTNFKRLLVHGELVGVEYTVAEASGS